MLFIAAKVIIYDDFGKNDGLFFRFCSISVYGIYFFATFATIL